MIAGRYSLDQEIGRGGMGAVWLGRDEVLGRPVALKRIGLPPMNSGASIPDLQRAEREARLAARLNHPHVVAVFDLVDDGDHQWLVMEYVAGTNLAELIADNGQLPPDQVAPILAQAADALTAAHVVGIVHRDVKPSNILVTPDGQMKLSDFGIARASTDAGITQTGMVTGSPAYLSPEVASGRPATPASDMWSLGATTFHAITGHPPYDLGDNVLGALYRIVHEDPPRPEGAGWLLPMLEHTMTGHPLDRWDAVTARDFLQRGPVTGNHRVTRPGTQVLRALPSPPPTPAAAAAPVTLAPTPLLESGARQGRPWFGIAVAVTVLALLTLVGLVLGLRGNGRDTTSDSDGSSRPPASARPTEASMSAFIRNYVSTAAANPQAGFRMLTPEFQRASRGLSGYETFWDSVTNPEVLSIKADPTTLKVAYVYQYDMQGTGRQRDSVQLQLRYADGSYLIAGEV